MAVVGSTLLAAQRDNPWDLYSNANPDNVLSVTTDGHSIIFEMNPNGTSTNQLWITLSNVYTGEIRIHGPILAVQGKPARPGTLRVEP